MSARIDRTVSNWFQTPAAVVLSLAVTLAFAAGVAADLQKPALLPTPKSLTVDEGAMPLSAGARIVANDASLEPLAAILSDEIWMVTNLRLAVAKGGAKAGDIVLSINAQVRADEDILAVQKQKVVRSRDFAHTIVVSDRAVIAGWDYRAVCEGTATLLQLIAEEGGKFVLPRVRIKDWPHADYTGTMVDVARQYIPIDALKMVVEACRLWKVRYIQVHLSDDHAYTFPSKAFPKLGTQNQAHAGGIPPKVYDLNELRGLVAYADARGVTLVPELETPGHSGAIRRCMPDPFEAPGVMNIASEKMYQALQTLIGEICMVFKSSPYFHIGCDECSPDGAVGTPGAKEYMQRHKLPGDTRPIRNGWECYVLHAIRMNEMVRKHGKVPIAWEGVADDDRLKNDLIVMTWYSGGHAQSLEQRGWTVITVPWSAGPLPAWSMYFCNGHTYQRTSNVLGASRPMWEMSATALVGGYAHGLCERQERTWGPDNGFKEDEYRKRMAASQALLDKLALPVKIKTEGRTTGVTHMLRGRDGFGGTLLVNLSAGFPSGAKIHYTLDGAEPTLQSPVYVGPLKFEKSFTLNAALFAGNRQIGCVTRAIYDRSD